MKNTIHLSSETTISYHYKPERDELTVQFRPATGTVHSESLVEWEHVQLQREQPSGEVIGFIISSVQQVLLEQLVRNLTTSLQPHFVAAPQADSPVEPLVEQDLTESDEWIPAGEAGETHALEGDSTTTAEVESFIGNSMVEAIFTSEEAAKAAPAKKSRSRRRSKAKAAPQPEAIAELEAILTSEEPTEEADSPPPAASSSVEMGVELIEWVAQEGTPPTTDSVTPEAEAQAAEPPPPAPAKKSRSRRSKGKKEESPAASTTGEAAPESSQPSVTAEELPIVEAVAEGTPAPKKSRSRRKKSTPAEASPIPQNEGEAESSEVPADSSEATPLATVEAAETTVVEASEATPFATVESVETAVVEGGASEAAPFATFETVEAAVAEDEADEADEGEGDSEGEGESTAAVAGEPAKRKRRKRRKRRNGGNGESAVVSTPSVPATPVASAPATPVAPSGTRHTHYATTIPPHTPAQSVAESTPVVRSAYKSEPIEGLDAPDEFLFMGLDPLVGQALHAMGYESPTAIQRRAVPDAMARRDIVGLAQTGTGKTLAFLLPSLHHMLKHPIQGHRPRLLVLTPTRELALQVATEAEYVATHTNFGIAAIYGQEDMKRQIRILRDGVDVVVATPGRLLDHLQRGTIRLNQVETVVLDEADRMLDMGFLPDVRKILNRVPGNRQTMMFSATMPQAVQSLSLDFQRDPVMIEVARQLPPSQIDQKLYPVERHLKIPLLEHLMKADIGMRSVMIFTETKAEADIVHRKLTELGFDPAIMHGDINQRERERALEQLRSGKVRMLVATNVAARGLDIQDVTHVINYEVPQTVDDYVHRIGRTARGEGTEGTAMTFMSSGDDGMIKRIESALERTLPRVYAEGFNYDVPTPSWAKPSADDIAESLTKPKNLAERFKHMMRRR